MLESCGIVWVAVQEVVDVGVRRKWFCSACSGCRCCGLEVCG